MVLWCAVSPNSLTVSQLTHSQSALCLPSLFVRSFVRSSVVVVVCLSAAAAANHSPSSLLTTHLLLLFLLAMHFVRLQCCVDSCACHCRWHCQTTPATRRDAPQRRRVCVWLPFHCQHCVELQSINQRAFNTSTLVRSDGLCFNTASDNERDTHDERAERPPLDRILSSCSSDFRCSDLVRSINVVNAFAALVSMHHLNRRRLAVAKQKSRQHEIQRQKSNRKLNSRPNASTKSVQQSSCQFQRLTRF